MKNILINFLKNLFQSFLIYPVTSIIGVISTILTFLLIDSLDYKYSDTYNLFLKLTTLSLLSISLFMSIEIISEELKNKIKNILIVLISIGLSFNIYLYFSWETFDEKTTIIKCLYFLLFHLLVAVSLINRNKDNNTFWQYNRLLFTSFLTTILFSGIMYAGVSIAIYAITNLFNIDLGNNIYAYVFAFIMIGFNTQYFLYSLTQNKLKINYFEFDSTYPKILKNIVVFVFIPLILLYLIILYAYSLKILIAWDIPRGWVSSLIFAYLVMGILSFLFVYPLREEEKFKWVKFYSKYFFILILPLFILLFIALYTRIEAYGVTPIRYFGAITSIWLFITTLYYIFSKSKRIQFITITLIVTIFVCLINPISFASFTLRSQLNSVDKIINKYKIKENLKSQKVTILKNKDYKTLESSIRVLCDYSNDEDLELYFKQIIKDKTFKIKASEKLALSKSYIIFDYLKVSKESINFDDNDDKKDYELEDDDKIIDISGFNKLTIFDSNIDTEIDSIGTITKNGITIKYNNSEKIFKVTENYNSFELNYNELFNLINEKRKYKSFVINNKNYKIYFDYLRMSQTINKTNLEIDYYRIYLLHN